MANHLERMQQLVEINNRIYWLDNLKFFAILCVVVGHCCSFFEYGVSVPYLSELNDFVDVFNMPLFMLISGFLSFNSLKSLNTNMHLEKRVLKVADNVARPSFFFSLFFFLCTSIPNSLIKSLFAAFCIVFLSIFVYFKDKSETFSLLYVLFLIILVALSIVAKPAYFWYMTMYMQTSFFVSCFFCFSNRKEYLWLVFAALLYLLSCYYFPLRGIDLLSSFLAGVFLQKKWHLIENRFCPLFFVLVVCFLLGVFLFPYVRDINFYEENAFQLIKQGNILFLLLRQISHIAFALFFMLLFYLLFKKKYFFTNWGRQTLYIYICSMLFSWRY